MDSQLHFCSKVTHLKLQKRKIVKKKINTTHLSNVVVLEESLEFLFLPPKQSYHHCCYWDPTVC